MSDEHKKYSTYRVWKGWDSMFTYSQDKADYFKGETVGLGITQSDVLEIGFGSGDLMQWMIDKGARACGIEINPELIDSARNRGVRIIDQNTENLTEKYADSFDTIIAFDVFEHLTISQIKDWLVLVERMLRPGGHLPLRFPNAQSPFGLAPQNGDPTHLTPLSRSVFENLLVNSGLGIVRYGHEYRATGRKASSIVARAVRSMARDLITYVLNFIYSSDIPYDPVVTLRVRKMGARLDTHNQ